MAGSSNSGPFPGGGTPPPPPSLMITHPPSTPSPSKRMRFLQADNCDSVIFSRSTCFNCKNQGHWARDCPLKINSPSPPPTFADAGDLPPQIECNNGHGPCTAKLARSGRFYYACAVGSPNGSKCSFFKWHDQLNNTKKGIGGPSPGPSDYPMCSCGAGRCQLMTETSQPNAGRSYFACPIAKGHGACPFFLWYDDGQANTELTAHVDESRHDGSLKSPLNGLQAIRTPTYDLDEYEEHPTSMRFESAEIDKPQPSPNYRLVPFGPSKTQEETVIGREEHHDTSSRETSANCSNLQVVLREPPHDLVLQEEGLCDPLLDKAPQVSQKASLQAARDTLTGGVFPSFNPIPIPKKRYESHGEGLIDMHYSPPHQHFHSTVQMASQDDDQPLSGVRFELSGVKNLIDMHYSPPRQHFHSSVQMTSQDDDQPLSGVLFELSGVKNLLGPLQDSAVTGTIVEALEQAALPIQNMLFTLLESMDPHKHESMTRAADCTFAALDHLSVDYRPFYERVKKLIGCASSLAEIDRSSQNDLSSQELIKRYHNEKDRFDDISRTHADTVGALTTCDDRLQVLRKEASRLREMLLQNENQQSACEAERSELETRVGEISKDMSKCEECVQAAAQKAEAAEELCREREVRRSEAKAAYEEARAKLR